MIEVEAALDLIAGHTKPLPSQTVPLPLSLQHVLAEDIRSDLDSPPFDKSMMDGYAVHAEDIQESATSLALAGTLMAGDVSTTELPRGAAVRIMTGAKLPPGANAVIPRELTDDPPTDSGATSVLIRSGTVAPNSHVLRQGTCMTAGQTILRRGTLIRSVELGILSEVGHVQVLVYRLPTAAVIATGSELIPVNQNPAAGQLRNSNGPMIAGLFCAARANSTNLGIGRDNSEELMQLVQQGLRHDILVLTGGVSAGDLDLVPGLLKQAGVRQIFHGVRLKPGKPVWFGCSASGKVVFGLPGNPVSSFVCCQLFVRAAIARMMGQQQIALPLRKGRLAHDHQVFGQRRTFWPGRFEPDEEHAQVRLLPWKGSADLLTWTTANCMVDLAAPGSLHASDLVDFMELTL